MTLIASWNVNGIRAATRKGLLNWLSDYSPDVLCLQEIKANTDQLTDDIINPEGYVSNWCSAVRKGYSGTAIYSKTEPLSVSRLGVEEFDNEGRTIIAEFEKFTVINCYFPNSQEAGARLDYKINFCNAILDKCESLRGEGKNIILCGDFNIAHTEIDLKNPKTNQNNPGFLPEEREWMTKFLNAGYTDTFRMFTKEGGHYSWWSYRFKARERNIGWRIDYHCVNKEFESSVKNAKILPDVLGSDHCPVIVELNG